jgi:hypothetical protein
MVTAIQIDKAKQVKKALTAAETANPGSAELTTLHEKLKALLDTFEADVPTADFQTLGGGTNKDGV